MHLRGCPSTTLGIGGAHGLQNAAAPTKNVWLESELNFWLEISDLQLNLWLESEAGALQQNFTQPQQLAPVQPPKVDEPQFVCDIWPAYDKIYVSGYEVPTCPYVFLIICYCLLPCCARLFLLGTRLVGDTATKFQDWIYYMYIYTYIYMYVCMHIYAYIYA